MQNQINTTPVAQFIQQVRIAEQTQSKEVKMSIHQARSLVLVLSEIQDKLLQDYETMFAELKKSVETDVISVAMDGGGFEQSNNR